MIDLHIHSTASDGTFTPPEIIKLAYDSRLKAISITDHDTIDGAVEAVRYGFPEGLEFVPGIEISADPPDEFPCSGSFHILGYFIDLEDAELNQTLKILQEARRNRNPQIINRLNQIGIDISIEDVQNFSDRQIGRPHIAKAMIHKGFVNSINEAFDLYLGKGKPAYVNKFRISSQQSIEMICKTGGIPVLAHPVLIKPLNDKPLEKLISLLKDFGIKGLEVLYSEHTPQQTAQYSQLAEKYDLLKTGGTDFHGHIKPDIMIGKGKGNLAIPYEYYEKLVLAARMS